MAGQGPRGGLTVELKSLRAPHLHQPLPRPCAELGIRACVLLFLKRTLKIVQTSGVTKHYPALRGPVLFAAV